MVDIQIQRGAIHLGHILYGYNGYLPKHSYIEVRKGTTVIADSAFNSKFEHRYDCRNLEGIVLPQGMKRIGASARLMTIPSYTFQKGQQRSTQKRSIGVGNGSITNL